MAAPWFKGFPSVISETEVQEVQGHYAFHAAKHGDLNAAWELVSQLVKPAAIERVSRDFGFAKLLVVGGEDATSNKIPMAFAHHLERQTGLPVHLGVVKANTPGHTGKNALARFVHRARFTGAVEEGMNYVLVDDVITQGGTLSELRQFVHRKGAWVEGVATLAHTPGHMKDARTLAVTDEALDDLDRKFGFQNVADLLREFKVYDGDPRCLTNGEAHMILKEHNLTVLRQHLTAAIKDFSQQPHEAPRSEKEHRSLVRRN